MSRTRISTGAVLFTRPGGPPAPEPRDDDHALHIAILGDFSARGSRGGEITGDLARRKAVEIDRDNFDEVFARLKVSLKLPFEEQPITFDEFDELHPDVLLEKLDLFAEFRKLLRQLRNKNSFESAAAQIRAWAAMDGSDQDAEADAPQESGEALPDDLFAAVLSESREQADAAMAAAGNVNRLIQAIVAPYIEPRENPDLARYQAIVEEAMAQTLRRIVHAPAFRRLEANWRSLQLLVSRLETDARLRLFVIDASHEELIDDVINAERIEDTALYTRLVLEQQVAGATPFSVLTSDLFIDDDTDTLRLATALAQIAETIGGLAICSASARLAGCDDLPDLEDARDWNYSVDAETLECWQSYRQESSARSLIACVPRFLARLPYGERTDPIESFPFEELGAGREHEFYCWAPGAYLATLTIGQGFSLAGWAGALDAVSEVEELPVHIYTDVEGDSQAQAIAEVFLRDRATEALAAVGLCSLRSIVGRDAVAIPHKRSVHLSGEISAWARR